MFLTILLLTGFFALGRSDLEDHRQTGDYNVHVGIEDMLVLALFGDGKEGSLDYSYDYSHLTVKPENPSYFTSPSTPVFLTTLVAAADSSTTAATVEAASVLPLLDYSYDYSDLTVKPENPSDFTSPSTPVSSTTLAAAADSSTTAAAVDAASVLPLVISENATAVKVPPEVTVASHAPTQEQHIPVTIITDDGGQKQYVSSSLIRQKATDGVPPIPLTHRKCSEGFFLDSRNRCKKIVGKNNYHRPRPLLQHGLRFAQRPAMGVGSIVEEKP